VPKPVKRALMLLVILLVVEYLILPQLAGVRKSLSLLSSVNFTFVLAGVVLEAGALAAYAQLTRAVIPRGTGPSFFTLLRIDLTTLAVSHILPGGAAAGSGLGYRLLSEAGVNGPDAAFALGTQSIGSAVVLNILLWVGLVISIPLRGFNPIYLTAAIVGVIVIGAFSGLVLLLTRGEDRAAQIFRAVARKLPFLDEMTVDGVVRRLAERVHALISDRALVRRAILWATANWLLDAASLWVFLAAFGYRVGVDGLIVSYGLANVLAAIPLTPGGLGVVEAVLTSSLVGFGSPRGVAILGVIGYRLVNFWLPIPLGGIASVSLRVDSGAPTKTKEELQRLAEEGREEAEDARTWAARHGIKVGQRSGDAA
jgi:uncharacterized protein (TIRG00374 family)